VDEKRKYWRGYLCFFLAAFLPCSIAAQDNGAATVRASNGDVLLNGQPSPSTSTIFLGTSVETAKNSSARISIAGSTIDVNSETSLIFDGDEISLDHGGVLVNTSRAFRVHAGCVIVTPVVEDWTQYSITATEENVEIRADKRDVDVSSRGSSSKAKSSHASLHESEHGSWAARCRAGAAPAGAAAAAARTGILNSPWAVGAGLGAIGVACVLEICRGDDPVSPSSPSGRR
jgi:hypothetical protein